MLVGMVELGRIERIPPREIPGFRPARGLFPFRFGRKTVAVPRFPSPPGAIGLGVGLTHEDNGMIRKSWGMSRFSGFWVGSPKIAPDRLVGMNEVALPLVVAW